ncbi:MAG: glycoside hydrolase family 9 protein [Bacteroidota bacterium]
MRTIQLTLLLALFGLAPLWSADIISVEVLHHQLLVVHIDDGEVRHHQLGETRQTEWVIGTPLDVDAAAKLNSYQLQSTEDSNYSTPLSPTQLHRKSKPTDFTWLCQSWNGNCVNTDRDHAAEHWLYLTLPSPLQSGKSYTLSIDSWTSEIITFDFDDQQSRSEAIHVNQIGYVPSAPKKYGYIYHWMGDSGGLPLTDFEDNRFYLVNTQTDGVAFTGNIAFRKTADNQETAWTAQSPPNGNFLGAEVYDCDFSTFNTPGSYRLCVENMGCSFPFDISDDIYQLPHTAVLNGLYQQRSGIALEAKYTDQPRPVPHHPELTPGFAGKLVYSTFRYPDFESNDSPTSQKDAIDAAVLGPLDVWGWYQDAGDWDSYYSHTEVPHLLLWLYEMSASKFGDGQLKLPEEANGLPDILDEAMWLPRFYHRLRQELLEKNYGTGGVGGGRVFGDMWGGDELEDGTTIGSWQDTHRQWVCTGEDPYMTFQYAALAAHINFLLQENGWNDPQNVDWRSEAQAAYDWAMENKLPTDNDLFGTPLLHLQLLAAAHLYRLTGENKYHAQFKNDFSQLDDQPELTEELTFALFTYTQTQATEETTYNRARQLLLNEADFVLLFAYDDRACRWSGNFWMPMLVGQATTPMIDIGVIGHYLVKDSDPAKAAEYRAVLYTTADYFLGTNPLNMSWITGVGERSPEEIFNIDSWYLGEGQPRYGIVPYGPWHTQQSLGPLGPWNHLWAFEYTYPESADEWPGHEYWFSQRTSPFSTEYTVHQNLAPSAFVYGYLYSLTAEDVATSTTSIATPNSTLTVSPNPTQDILRINTDIQEHTAYQIFDVQGRQVQHGWLQQPELSVQKLPASTYLLQLTQKDGMKQTAKFVVLPK